MEKAPPSLPSPSLLGACAKSFYPQAKVSAFQSWVGGGAERKEEGNIIPLVGVGEMGHHRRLAGAGQSFWLESLWLISPRPAPCAHTTTSWEGVLSHNAMCPCV